jgi:hypothetical protein
MDSTQYAVYFYVGTMGMGKTEIHFKSMHTVRTGAIFRGNNISTFVIALFDDNNGRSVRRGANSTVFIRMH